MNSINLKRKIMFKRGASILPSLFTLANMFFGYLSIIYSIKGRYEESVNFVLFAAILDALDGRIARITKTTSEFGKELDSLADFLSFGVAPALVLYFWGFSELGRFGFVLVFLLPLAGAIRLARFNVQSQVVDKRYFVGLPIPAGACSALFPLYYLGDVDVTQILNSSGSLMYIIKSFSLFYIVLISFLMVSTIKYRSFKEFDIRERRPFYFFFFMTFFILLIILHPQFMLLILSVLYLFSGPAQFFYEKLKTFYFKKS